MIYRCPRCKESWNILDGMVKNKTAVCSNCGVEGEEVKLHYRPQSVAFKPKTRNKP